MVQRKGLRMWSGLKKMALVGLSRRTEEECSSRQINIYTEIVGKEAKEGEKAKRASVSGRARRRDDMAPSIPFFPRLLRLSRW